MRVLVARIAPVLLPLATLLFCLAAARPQAGREMRQVVSEGIDIVLAIDQSGSMRCEDFRPQNRLYVAKQVAKQFLRGRTQDRIALVGFAGRSELISPLTLDYEGLASLIDGLDFGQLPDGTAVGGAVAQGAYVLRSAKGKSRVMILLTDGINNAGPVDPVTARVSRRRSACGSTRSARARWGRRRIRSTIPCSGATTSGCAPTSTSRRSSRWRP
jgi:Ca-activated chloride channel family protein